MSKEYERIIAKLSEETGISKIKIELAVASQFKGVKKIIEKGEWENVRLRYLGKFEVSKKRLNNLKKDKDGED